MHFCIFEKNMRFHQMSNYESWCVKCSNQLVLVLSKVIHDTPAVHTCILHVHKYSAEIQTCTTGCRFCRTDDNSYDVRTRSRWRHEPTTVSPCYQRKLSGGRILLGIAFVICCTISICQWTKIENSTYVSLIVMIIWLQIQDLNLVEQKKN